MNRIIKIGLTTLVLLAAGCGGVPTTVQYGEPARFGQPRFQEARPYHGESRLVLPTLAAVQDPEALSEYNFESVRRDDALAAGLLDRDLAVPYYQGEYAPGLDETRWLYLSDNPRRVTYYSTYRRDRRRW